MWSFQKAKGGYIRSLSMDSNEQFMFTILTYDKTRALWRKIIGWTWCVLFHHKQSGICIRKGYIEKYGTFKLDICKHCYAGVLFCERDIK